MSRWKTGLGFLLGILGPIAFPLFFDLFLAPAEPPRQVFVPQSFVEVADAIDAYKAKNGKVPPDLEALVPDFLDAVPPGPSTQQPYIYEPDADGQGAELLSLGADGRPGGDGANGDASLKALSMGPPAPPPERQTAWLVNLSFLLTPLAAFVGGRRNPWAVGALSGSACFTGVLLAAAAFANVTTIAALALCCVSAVVAVAAGALVLRDTRGSRVVAVIALVLSWAQLTLLAAA